jgi:carbon-monoxide dehydrogenase medium subunit
MKPAPFEYQAPDSLEGALAILAEHGDDAKVLAGGQSLIPAMNFRVAQPAMLVDLNGLSELDYIRRAEDGELQIGAMTRQRSVEREPLVAETDPLLNETMPFIAHPQIRNRGTFGGNMAHADPASELPVIAVARGARMKAASAKGERWIDAKDFFFGMFTTALEPEEILAEIALPPMPARTGWSFMEISRRSGDYAMMGVAALVTLDENDICAEARLVYLNTGDGPMEASEAAQLLQGEKHGEKAIEAAAVKASEDEIDPFGNVHASVEYQRHLARVLTRRALNAAFERTLTSDGE